MRQVTQLEKCIHCGQLILTKISEIGATRCQILRLKCTKFDFCWGSDQDPAGELTALAVFKGPTYKGRELEGEWSGRGRGTERKQEGRGGEGRRKGEGNRGRGP